jgi:polyribonucleotide nucleotidyltransferase
LSTTLNQLFGTQLHDNLVHATKQGREGAVDELQDQAVGQLEEQGWDAADVKTAFESLIKKTTRAMILKENTRPDGRSRTQIRDLKVEVGVLPRVHGSGLFSRGQTQALTVATLGSASDTQKIDGLSGDVVKRYMHHYNFPASALVKRVRRVDRAAGRSAMACSRSGPWKR